VGDAIAANAWPARIGRDGTLHVATADSVWSFELAQRATEIADRVGVARVRFQPGPLPSVAAVPAADGGLEPTSADRCRAAEIAAPIADENLRQTVQKAVSLALARGAVDRPF
jgi:hypothetical protein